MTRCGDSLSCVDGRCDVFALGVCMYEGLTGKSLYHQKIEYETMRAVIDGPVPSIRDVNPKLPAELDAIVQKALQKNRENRFESAGAMENALEEWLAESRQVVTDAKLSDYMQEIYAEEIERGPLVDSTPFGQSIKHPAHVAPGLDESGELPDLDVQLDSRPPRSGAGRRKVLGVVAAVLLVVAGVGGGLLLRGGPEPSVARSPQAPAPSAPTRPPPPTLTIAAPAPVVAPTTGSASLTSVPEGASVTLDGDALEGTTPLTLPDLEPGTHTLTFSLSDHHDVTTPLTVEAGAEARYEATLEHMRHVAAAPPGRLSINTRPWSKVYVGRRLLGTTPIGEASVPSGTVRLRLVDRDGNTYHKTVRVPPGQDARVFYDLQ